MNSKLEILKPRIDNNQILIHPTVSERKLRLLQNYPNPCNPETWIPYELPTEAQVRIKIYGVAGRVVRTIHLGKKQAGLYLDKTQAAYWNGRNDAGQKVASGVYFYALEAGGNSIVRRLVLMK